MSVSLSTIFNGYQSFLQNGLPNAGGAIYTYLAGTSTPAATYTNNGGAIANANPILLSIGGTPPNAIWLADGVAYKFSVVDAFGAQVPGGQFDNVTGSGSGSLLTSTGAGLIGWIQSGIGAVSRTVMDKLRESITLADFSTPAQAVIAASGKRLFVAPGETVSLNIPAQFGSIQSAMTALANWVIHGTAQIVLSDGTYNQTGTIVLNHPYGQNIQIVGNVAAPDNCIIFGTNPPTFDLFVVSSGNKFGLISGVRADLAAKPGQANNFTAFLALNGAALAVDNCKSNNWYYGVSERNGATIKCTNSTVTNAGDVGVWAFAGGSIQCSNVQSNNITDAANSLGFGFQGEFGGVIEAQNCSSTGCLVAGFAALSNGTGRYYNCTSNANTGSGFMSRGGGQMEANGSSSTNNARYGIEITEYGNIINLGTNTGNTLGAASKFPYLDTSTGSARLAASSGQLRIDTSDTSSVFINTSGGAQAEIRHRASAVNRPFLQGGATGGEVVVGADGTDTVIDLALLPKGPGSYVKVGAGYFTPAPTPNGYFLLRLNDGSLVQIPCFK